MSDDRAPAYWFEGNGLPYDEAVCWMLTREQREVEIVARFTLDGEPISKARARFTGYGSKVRAYTPEKTANGQQRVAWAFRQAAPGHVAEKETTYGVMAVFFAGTRQRRDVDNMLKLILDGLNGVAWHDDVQVHEVSGRRGTATKEDARTEVLIYKVGQVHRASATCEMCGHAFNTYNSWSARRFCTDECHLAWRAARRQMTCAQCGKDFDRGSNTKASYCSKPCADLARRVVVKCDHCGEEFTKQQCHLRATNYCTPRCSQDAQIKRRKGVAKGPCITCDQGVSRKEYTQCAACRAARRSVTGKPIPSALTNGPQGPETDRSPL